MLTGDPDAIFWADKVLADPTLVTPVVLVETLITRATAKLNAGSIVEAEVGLRGAIVVADRLGDPMAALRARNNLMGIIWPVSLESALVLCREMHDIGIRFGQRTWINQATGTALGASFDIGRWEDWLDEMREAEPDASEFYVMWFRSEMARRIAYRGRTSEALGITEEILASEVVQNSGQGSAGIEQLTGEFAYLEGRWNDAYEIGRRGWTIVEIREGSLRESSFAAVAAADLERTDAVNDAMAKNLDRRVPEHGRLAADGSDIQGPARGPLGRRSAYVHRGLTDARRDAAASTQGASSSSRSVIWPASDSPKRPKAWARQRRSSRSGEPARSSPTTGRRLSGRRRIAVAASARSEAPSRSIEREGGSGGRVGLGDAPDGEAELPGVDRRRLDAERRQRRADLAPVVGAVVERLRKADPDRRLLPVAIVLVDLLEDRVGVEVAGQEIGPFRVVPLHRGPQLPEVHVVLVEEVGPVAAEREQVPGVGADRVPHRDQDGAVGSGHRGLELLRRQ